MVAGSPSVAVRIYNIHDVQRLEKELSADDNNHNDNQGVDGLKHFRASYEHSVVFFVLSSNHQRDQLSRRDSFFHLAQRTNIRIVIVADVSQAITSISSIVQSLAPEKREKKRAYFAQIAEKNYLPSSMMRGGGVEPTQQTIANYAKEAMINWADRMEMQRGDINIALDMLGSVAGVVTATKSDLDSIPITSASKDVIRHFFGQIARDEKEGTSDDNCNTEDSELFGDNDDSELLNIPDPSPAAAAETLDQNMYYQGESYDEYDVPLGVGHGHSSYEQQHPSYQNQARDFYTPINPSFARRRVDQVHHHGNHGTQYDYPGMNSHTGHYPSADHYRHQEEYDDYNDYSRSVRQYTNQFM